MVDFSFVCASEYAFFAFFACAIIPSPFTALIATTANINNTIIVIIND